MNLHIGSRSLSVLLATGTLLATLQLTSCSDAIDQPPQQPGSAAPNPAPLPTTPGPAPSDVPDYTLRQGNYGGENIEMKLTDAGATFRFGCADGTIPGKIETDSQGAFEKTGTYRSTSGPVPEGGYPVFPARYVGTVYRGVVNISAAYSDAENRELSPTWNAVYGENAHFTVICATSTGGGTLQ